MRVEEVPHGEHVCREVDDELSLIVGLDGEGNLTRTTAINIGTDRVQVRGNFTVANRVGNGQAKQSLGLCGGITPLVIIVLLEVDQVKDLRITIGHGVCPNGVCASVGADVMPLDRHSSADAVKLGSVEDIFVTGNDVVVVTQPVLQLIAHELDAVREEGAIEHVVVLAQFQVVRAVCREYRVSQLNGRSVKGRDRQRVNVDISVIALIELVGDCVLSLVQPRAPGLARAPPGPDVRVVVEMCRA